ncbi:MAG: glycosyltransferase [Prolixibacteraceae bacterium]|nr:glycosyltransferase [Prolixibacteraceae bacterium]
MAVEFGGFQFSIEEFIGLVVFGLSFLVQLFYLILLIKFIFSGKQKNKEPNLPSISIVVTSRNYLEQLRELLPTLLTQDYPDFEIVVVDDCSTDGTDWLLAELKISHGNLKTTKIIQETDFPNALAITIGVRASSKVWLVFLSPLCRIPDNQWLRDYAQRLEPDKEVSIGYMHFNQATGNYKSWLRFENFTSFLLSGAGQACGLAMPVFEYNMAYRRETFLDLRGFAAVLDSPFSENELFINKIGNRKNTVVLNNKTTPVAFTGETEWIDLVEFKKKQLMLRRKFSAGQRFFRTLNLISRLTLTASLILLLIVSPLLYWILGIWGFLLLFEMTWIGVATKKVGEKNFLPMLLIYKAFLPFINIYFVIVQLFTGQKRKWK